MQKQKLFVYIIHSPRLDRRSDRVSDVRSRLLKHSFSNVILKDVVVITQNEPKDITPNHIQKYVNYDQPIEENLKSFAGFNKNMHINQLSQALKHAHALECIAAHASNDVWGLVIEDDVLYQDNEFCDSLDTLMKHVNSSKQIVFLGMPMYQSTSDKQPKDQIPPINREAFGLIPIVENFLIHSTCAKNMSAVFLPIKYTMNIHMNYIIAKLAITCYQTMFPIFINGSKYGAYVSSTSPCNALVYNKEYMELFELIKSIEDKTMQVSDQSTVVKVAEILGKASNISQHPDFVHLIGRFKGLQGKYAEAIKFFTRSIEALEKEHGIINHESWSLRELIRAYKHVQTVP